MSKKGVIIEVLEPRSAKQLRKKVVCPPRLHWVPDTLSLHISWHIILICNFSTWYFSQHKFWSNKKSDMQKNKFSVHLLKTHSTSQNWYIIRNQEEIDSIFGHIWIWICRYIYSLCFPLPSPSRFHYFTLFTRISRAHLSFRVGHISPK